eukprot:CAMPEP_0119154820 /NCGR_PEP_ID=MMETSP1310-20130426/51333_1 /TAXON_ID=464262 /ORGANISM="Genus nov. species nov., Strain RCC2339" /LENGTH=83 /DNA_ID=CAMNT_0007147385 /DNA_START=105 /DNA_END=352 /DNA_ORIENTATION=-
MARGAETKEQVLALGAVVEELGLAESAGPYGGSDLLSTSGLLLGRAVSDIADTERHSQTQDEEGAAQDAILRLAALLPYLSSP